MKLLIMLDEGKVYRLTRPRKSLNAVIESERCVIVDVDKLTFYNPEEPDEILDVESDTELDGTDEEMDEDEVYVGDMEIEDEEADLEAYDDEEDYG